MSSRVLVSRVQAVRSLLEHVLLTEKHNLGLWLSVCCVAHQTETQDLIFDVLNLLSRHDPQQTSNFISQIINEEIASTTHFEEIFREESWLCTVLKQYMQRDVLLFTTPLIKTLLRATTKIKLKGKSIREQLIHANVGGVVEDFFSSFFEGLHRFPASVGFVFSRIAFAARIKFGAHTPVAMTVFFLRFVCPGIVSPVTIGLLKKPPSAELTRVLVFISKIILEIVNGTSTEFLAPYIALNTVQKLRLQVNQFDTATQIHFNASPRLVLRGYEKDCSTSKSRIARFICESDSLILKRQLRKFKAPERVIQQLCGSKIMKIAPPSKQEVDQMKTLHQKRLRQTINSAPPCEWSKEALCLWISENFDSDSEGTILKFVEQRVESVSAFLSLDPRTESLKQVGHQKRIARLQRKLRDMMSTPNSNTFLFRTTSNTHISLVRQPSFDSGSMDSASSGADLEVDINDDPGLAVLSFKSPSSWSVDNVSTWLLVNGLGNYLEDFSEVNGQALLELDAKKLDELNIFKKGHRLRLLHRIEDLKKQDSASDTAEPFLWSSTRVGSWLKEIGLEQYSSLFQENHVDGWKLFSADSNTLKAIGVQKVGHRKIVLREKNLLYDAPITPRNDET